MSFGKPQNYKNRAAKIARTSTVLPWENPGKPGEACSYIHEPGSNCCTVEFTNNLNKCGLSFLFQRTEGSVLVYIIR